MMSFADFCVGMRLREVTLEEIAKSSERPETLQYLQQHFKQQTRPGDVIYHYCSEPSMWDLGMGSEGYIVVRDGQIVDSLVLRMN
jgi:hypothetical protein